jgi:hypothetical protein
MELVTVLPGHRLDAEVVASWRAWDAEVRRRIGGAPAYTEMYRSPAEQDRLYNGWIRRLPGFNPAYRSTDKRARHILGRAIDWGFAGRAAAQATAAQFGWAFNVPGEPWHAEFIKHVPLPGAPAPKPAPFKRRAKMYSFVKDAKSATVFACSLTNGKRVGIGSPYHLALLKRFRDNEGGDPMLVAELDIVKSYLSQLA